MCGSKNNRDELRPGAHGRPLLNCSWWEELCKGSESESRSVVSDSLRPHGLQSMEFSRPEYWSG